MSLCSACAADVWYNTKMPMGMNPIRAFFDAYTSPVAVLLFSQQEGTSTTPSSSEVEESAQ